MTQFPLHLMSGAEWNILDDTGKRVALCHSNDGGDATADDIMLAQRIVNTMNAAWKEGQITPPFPQGRPVTQRK